MLFRSGLAIPSRNDLEMTDFLRTALEHIQVTLVEHLIIVDDRFCPILQPRYENFRCPPGGRQVDRAFYEHFYNVSAETWTAAPLFDGQPVKK